MDFDGEDYSDVDADVITELFSQASEALSLPRADRRNSKKRRIAPSTDDDEEGSLDDFIVDDSDDVSYNGQNSSSRPPADYDSDGQKDAYKNDQATCVTRLRTSTTSRPARGASKSTARARKLKHRSRDSTDLESQTEQTDDDDDLAKAQKKSKHRIHIPLDQKVPEAVFEYATQLPEELSNPDSSPYRIRGPRWIIQKPRPPAMKGAPIHPQKEKVASAPQQATIHSFLQHKPSVIPSERNFPQQTILSGENKIVDAILPPTGPSQTGPSQLDFSYELDDLPSDAFSSPEKDLDAALSPHPPRESTPSRPRQALVAPQNGLRQTTLFGSRPSQTELPASQVNKRHNYVVDLPPEEPTHHKLDHEALKTWVYPTNLGDTREYQYNIVSGGLFSNMLVALPTGLGKTFIAATIMLNYYRWTKDSQIVFMAPTKPLVAQQIDACFNIAGIPRSATTLLTGEIPPAVRAEEWAEKRVFFMTPQTLDNDLRTGIADPKKIVLLVVDEAHRATGNYSYVKVVEFIRRFSKSFRILALTATPGSKVETVQEVIDGLEISKVEIRTEESIDIQQFVHQRNVDEIIHSPSDEMLMVQELYSKSLQPLVDLLCSQNAYYNKDPMSLSPFSLMEARKRWFADAGRNASQGLKGMMMGLFSVLASVAHGIKLLHFHGITPFYETVRDLRSSVQDNGEKGSKYRRQIVESAHFKKMMDRVQAWVNKEDFMGHPKLVTLSQTILNHFLDAGAGRLGSDAPPSATRVIVFAEYRDSAEEIARILNKHEGLIRASVFVGQADSKRSSGMNQAKQQQTIDKFKTGTFNVIIATSIGEEGLDIGQVDLIVCYDASASPIRMLQRMGRTGRKRAGKIVLLLMDGKEKDNFQKAKHNYEQMQKMICDGSRFSFRHDLSTRIVPRDIRPTVDKRHVEIPFENTQNPALPEPKRRAGKGKKRPEKKFNMPDGVETGFRKASKLSKKADTPEPSELSPEQLMSIPTLESVLLNDKEVIELHHRFQDVQDDAIREVEMPEMTKHPESQLTLRRTKSVPHGQHTRRFVETLRSMHFMNMDITNNWEDLYEEHGPFKGAVKSAFSQSPIQSLREEVEQDVEGDGIELRTTNPTVIKKTNLGRKSTQSFRGISLVDSSDNSMSDDDKDLEDFLVTDREIVSARHDEPTMFSSPPNLHTQPPSKLFFEPTQFSATQDTIDEDQEIPDLTAVFGKVKAPSSRSPLTEAFSNENSQPAVKHRAKRRRVVVEDNDSDE
jgi:ATP-dependent DNA helicase MPH1